MPTPAQEYEIAYGGLTMGGTSPYTIDGGPSLSQKPSEDGSNPTASFAWRVFVQDDDRAAFEAKCKEIEDQFIVRFQDLTVQIGGEERISWKHSTNTGFNAEPAYAEIPDASNTGFSRAYRLSVTVGLPASDNDGIREAQASIRHDPSDIRRVSFSGTYTATAGGSNALAVYNSKVDGYCSGILAAIGGGPYELAEETPIRRDQDKLTPWTRVYDEIIFPQTPNETDNSAIVRHSVKFSRSTPGPGDTQGGRYSVSRLTAASASYVCNVRQTVTKNLEQLWTGTLRQYVLDQASARFNASIVSVTVDDLQTDPTTNMISASLTLLMQTKGSTAFSYTVTQEYADDPGAVIRRVYGQRYGKYVYTGPADSDRITTVTAELNSLEALGKVQGYPNLASNEQNIDGGKQPPPRTRGWVEVAPRTHSVSPVTIGIPGLGTPTTASRVVTVIRETWVQTPSATTGGGRPAPGQSVPQQPGQFQQPGGSRVASPPPASRTPGVVGGGFQPRAGTGTTGILPRGVV